MARYIGADLHRRRFTVCTLVAKGRSYLSQYWLDQLPQFARKLRPTDQVAVEGQRQHAAVLQGGGSARGPGGGQPHAVPADLPVGEKDRPA